MTQQADYTALAAATQRQAADPAVSAWVSASAGSGKTKVLIDRFVRLLLDGTPPQKILCLTYTQAAAAEMIDRVTQRLSHWAICGEEELDHALVALTQATDVGVRKRHIAKARTLFAAVLDCPGKLRIKTFHAFAQEILARFPLEAGVAPHFTVLEEEAATALREEALADVLVRLEEEPGLQTAWAVLAGAVDAEQVQDLLRQAVHDQRKMGMALARHDGMAGLIAALYRQMQLDPAMTRAAMLQAACADEWLPMAALRQSAAVFLAEGKDAMAELVESWLAWTVDERAGRFEDYRAVFLTDKNTVRKSLVKAASERAYPDMAAALREEAERILQVVQAGQKRERVGITAAVVELGAALLAAYTARKAQRAALDFDDVINRTEALLMREGIAPWVLWKLDGGIDHIMIDEAQDTSPAQWQIIKALAAEFFAGVGAREAARTLFVVGDEKQSIYSFQHADPKQFWVMANYFQEQAAQAGKKFVQLSLNVSFRSAPLVLEKIDAVFGLQAREGVSAAAITHQASKAQMPGYVRFWPLVRPAERAERGVWTPPVDYQLASVPAVQLAEMIAGQISGWCREGTRPGDIMILVQRRKALVAALVRALKQRGVPVSGADRLVLREAISIKDMLALVQFVLLPEDDLNLACVLRGPLVGMDEAALERLCVGRAGRLWERLRAERGAVQDWLRALLGLADYGTVHDFLAHILQQPCPMAASGKMALVARLGRDALDPLDELLNRAQRFGLQQPDSLQGFLQFMLGDETQIKRALEKGAGEVRIMTVHAAKGLEAPIVIMPDSCRVARAQDMSRLQWDETLLLPYYTGGGKEERDDFATALHGAAHAAQLEEYRRLMYVALTRAQQALHVYGYHGPEKPKDFEQSWYELIRQGWGIPEEQDAAWGDAAALRSGVIAVEDERDAALPGWAFAPAVHEAVVRPLSPSQLGAADVAVSPARLGGALQRGFERGRLVHLLLQYLPGLPETRRADAAARFLQRRAADWDERERAELAVEVLRVIGQPDYAALFGTESRAEVPLMGLVALDDGVSVMMSGQVDRLVLDGDAVMVVDYKTNRPPPGDMAGVSAAYRKQMAAYRALLRQIYPGKRVRCFLLWTYDATMMELAEEDAGWQALDRVGGAA